MDLERTEILTTLSISIYGHGFSVRLRKCPLIFLGSFVFGVEFPHTSP